MAEKQHRESTNTPLLHRVGTATAEGSTYRAEYRGRTIWVTRLTDPNADGGTPETRWDGLVGVVLPFAECYALCCGTRAEALAQTIRLLDQEIEGERAS